MIIVAVPVLIALFVAFAADPGAPPVSARSNELARGLFEACAGLGLSAAVALAIGLALSVEIRRRGHPDASTRRVVQLASFLVQALNLGVYTWLIHGLRWPGIVRNGMGLRGSVVLDEIVILLPYLVAELLGWASLYPAVRAARTPSTPSNVLAYLVLRSRQTFGLVLPIVILFWVGDRLSHRVLPGTADIPAVRVLVTLAVGVLVVLIAPAFVRLASPSYPMPPGPLRARLESLSRRFRFRYSQIRILETEGTVCNAMIVGILPRFRHVLLSDGLIDQLNDEEVEAVFAHEMGHVYHHHSALVGLFGLGSIGVMALLNQCVDVAFAVLGPGGSYAGATVDLIKAGLVLGLVALYLRLVFGPLSRRIEREADIFGCEAVSCGRPDCPPHVDSHARSEVFCPVGVRICVGALETVAHRSGLDIAARDWRHGTIADRVDFLRALAGRRIAGTRLRRDMLLLRMLVALALASTVVLALLTGAFEGATRV
jgi:STE24 endopeptidase